MLIISSAQARTPAVDKLVKTWARRYTPQPFSTDCADHKELRQRLIDMASTVRRQQTAFKLNQRIIEIKCQMASIRTRYLYSYIPNVVSLNDARRLSDFALLIYLKLAEIYQRSPAPVLNREKLLSSALLTDPEDESAWSLLSMEAWGMPSVEQLAEELRPLLLEYQHQHTRSDDWRTLGFLTTLLNFANQLILEGLTEEE